MPLTKAQYNKKIQALRKKRQQKPGPNRQLQKKIRKLRRARNALPKVNPNPKPPGAGGGGGGGQSVQGGAQGSLGQSYTYPGASATGGSSSGIPNMPAPSPGPAAAPTDPRDAQYFRDVLQLQEARNQEVQQLQTESTFGRTAMESALQDLARQNPKDILSYREGANTAGALYSSATGEGLGQIQEQYLGNVRGTQMEYENEERLRETARQAIARGYTQDEAAALAEATERASQAELDRPAPMLEAYGEGAYAGTEDFGPYEPTGGGYQQPDVAGIISSIYQGIGGAYPGQKAPSLGGGKKSSKKTSKKTSKKSTKKKASAKKTSQKKKSGGKRKQQQRPQKRKRPQQRRRRR